MIRALACAAALCTPVTASAQDHDLQTALDATFAPLAHVETLPDTLGCAALYRSLNRVLGPDSEFNAEFTRRGGFMTAIAGVVWSRRADAAQGESVLTALLPPIVDAAEHYIAHMDIVVTQTGEPFDDVILDQIDFCDAMFEALQ